MSSLIKQMIIVLLSFSSSLARVANLTDQTKCLSLNDEPCMVITALIHLKFIKIKFYLFIFGLDKCSGSFNVLSPKICVLKKQKTLVLKYLI